MFPMFDPNLVQNNIFFEYEGSMQQVQPSSANQDGKHCRAKQTTERTVTPTQATICHHHVIEFRTWHLATSINVCLLHLLPHHPCAAVHPACCHYIYTTYHPLISNFISLIWVSMCSMLLATVQSYYSQLRRVKQQKEAREIEDQDQPVYFYFYFLRMEGLRRKPQSTSKVHSSLSPTRCIFLERSDVMYDGRRRYSKYGIGLSWYVSPLNHC